MFLAFVGSRTYPRLPLVAQTVRWLNDELTFVLVSGHGGAVDCLAEQTQQACQAPYLIYPAEWRKYGKRAGYLRNVDIVRASDGVIAFWDGQSRGTRATLRHAELEKKPVFVITDQSFDAIKIGITTLIKSLKV